MGGRYLPPVFQVRPKLAGAHAFLEKPSLRRVSRQPERGGEVLPRRLAVPATELELADRSRQERIALEPTAIARFRATTGDGATAIRRS
jgi:hypothetical protein